MHNQESLEKSRLTEEGLENDHQLGLHYPRQVSLSYCTCVRKDENKGRIFIESGICQRSTPCIMLHLWILGTDDLRGVDARKRKRENCMQHCNFFVKWRVQSTEIMDLSLPSFPTKAVLPSQHLPLLVRVAHSTLTTMNLIQRPFHNAFKEH